MSIEVNLSIADEWQGIQIIAGTQLVPRKAVAELIENSIDAGAKHILVVREKLRGETILRIQDDGRGVDHCEDAGKLIYSDDIATNLSRIPTHICDSIKRKQEAKDKKGVIGEYGIGILGFWRLGQTFHLRSRTSGSDTYTLIMECQKRSARVEKAKEPMAKAGTEVTIIGLFDTTKRLLSAQRLGDYLARELRGRLLDTGTEIEIEDKLPGGGKIRVQPMPFSGERLSDFPEAVTQTGQVANLELYMNFAATSSEPAQVGLYRKGTRLVPNLIELEDLQHEPWTLNILEGKVEYPYLSTSPATRTGVATDKDFAELVSALKNIEPIIIKQIKQRQKELREEQKSEFVDFLKDAFKRIFRDLPEEYEFFKGPKTKPPPPLKLGPLAKVEIVPGSIAIVLGSRWQFTAEPTDENDYTVREGVTFLWDLSPEIGELRGKDKKTCEVVAGKKPGEATLSVEVRQGTHSAHSKAELRVVEHCGELSTVTVLPRVGVVWRAYSRNLTTTCTDEEGIHIPSVKVQWLCPPTHGIFSSIAGLKATFQAKSDAPLGSMTVKVTAKTQNKQLEGSSTLYITVPQKVGDKFPPPIPLREPLSSWRSRWDPDGFQLYVNYEHPDYKRAEREGIVKGYIALLYAKELVLMSFGKTSSPSDLLERLVEVETHLFPLILRELSS
jgi:hypothetical protein